MRPTSRLGRFKRDVRRPEKRGKEPSKLRATIFLKANGAAGATCLSSRIGLLIYSIEDGELKLGRTGTHADIFQQ
jgi:hypothetical protein